MSHLDRMRGLLAASIEAEKVPQRFRKRPVEILAMQWTGDNEAAIQASGSVSSCCATAPGSIRASPTSSSRRTRRCGNA